MTPRSRQTSAISSTGRRVPVVKVTWERLRTRVLAEMAPTTESEQLAADAGGTGKGEGPERHILRRLLTICQGQRPPICS